MYILCKQIIHTLFFYIMDRNHINILNYLVIGDISYILVPYFMEHCKVIHSIVQFIWYNIQILHNI